MRKINKKLNMLNANILAEKFYFNKKNQLTEEDNKEETLTFTTLPDCVKDNFNKNITVSVAFVKKDGSVRHMAFRRNLLSYIKSDKEKTEKQMNVLKNNNLMNVYDTNVFIKSKKENINNGMNQQEADEDAAKKSFRNFKLENVMAFLCNGKVYDMRKKNNIAKRFSEEVAAQLTKQMISKMNSDEILNNQIDENIDNAPKPIGEEGIKEQITRLAKKRDFLINQKKQIEKEIKEINEQIKKWNKEISPNQLQMF